MAGTAIDSFFVSFMLDSSAYKKGAGEVQVATKKVKESTKSSVDEIQKRQKVVSDSFSKMAKETLAFFAVVAGGRSLEQLFIGNIGTAATIGRTATAIGAVTAKLSALNNVLYQGGGGATDASSVGTNISSAIQAHKLFGENNQISSLLQTLHIPQFANGQQRDPTDIILDLAAKFKTMPELQAQTEGAVFGMNQANVETLRDTPQAVLLQEMKTQASVNEASAKAAEAAQASWRKMQTSVDTLANDIFPKLIPAMKMFTQYIQQIDDVVTGKKPLSSLYENSPSVLTSAPPAPTGTAKANAASIMQQLQAGGLSKNQAAMVTGALSGESSKFDPNAINPKSGAYGIGQWWGTRKTALFAKYGAHPTLQQQVAFLLSELHGSEGASLSALTDPSNVNVGLGAANFTSNYERPYDASWTASQIAADKAKRGVQAERLAGVYGLPSWMTESANTMLNQLGIHPALPGNVTGIINRLRTQQSAKPTTINIASITVNAPQARDAAGIARAIHQGLREQKIVAQANVAYN